MFKKQQRAGLLLGALILSASAPMVATAPTASPIVYTLTQDQLNAAFRSYNWGIATDFLKYTAIATLLAGTVKAGVYVYKNKDNLYANTKKSLCSIWNNYTLQSPITLRWPIKFIGQKPGEDKNGARQ